jgi:hypothetical protein
MLDLSRNPILNPLISAAGVENDLKSLPHLTEDRPLIVRNARHRCRDARKLTTAVEALERLPDADEVLHLVISGRFALWHLVPAVAELSGSRIDQLRIATLGFSRENVESLCAMLDAGTIGHARLLCSHYFKGTSGEIYQLAQDELAKRSDRAKFLSVRTHAKLLCMKLAGGRTLCVESSANLRSCKNIEQMTLIGSPRVYRFHARWIDELFAEAEQEGSSNDADQVSDDRKK